MPDAAVVVLGVAPGEVVVQLSQGLDLGHGDGVVAAEPAPLTLDPTLFVGAFDTGTAVEHVEAVVRAEQHPPVRLDPGPAGQHPGDGGFQIVVADVDGRDPAQLLERVAVAVQERFLRGRRIGAVDRLARVGQPKREQKHLGLHPGPHDPQISEVDLRLRTGRVVLRDEHLGQLPTRLRRDPRPGLPHIVTHRRIGHHQLVLLDQPIADPQRGMTLLARRVQIRPEHRVDQRLHRVQHRRRTHRHLPRRWLRRGEGLPHRPPVDPMPHRELADRHIRIIPPVPTDRFEHPDTTPNRHSGPPSRSSTNLPSTSVRWGQIRPSQPPRSVAAGARSDRHGGAKSECHFQIRFPAADAWPTS